MCACRGSLLAYQCGCFRVLQHLLMHGMLKCPVCLPVIVDGEELHVQNGQTQLTHSVAIDGEIQCPHCTGEHPASQLCLSINSAGILLVWQALGS